MSSHAENDSKDALLSALEAHGKEFLSSFGSLEDGPKFKRRKLQHERKAQLDEDATGEWHGFEEESESSHSNEEEEDDGEPCHDFALIMILIIDARRRFCRAQ